MRLHSFHMMMRSATGTLARSRPLLQWMSLLILILWTISGLTDSLQAQRTPEVDNRFRQASEAMRKGNLDEAAEGFAAVVKEAPTFAEAHFNLGTIHQALGDPVRAAARFQEAIRLRATYVWICCLH